MSEVINSGEIVHELRAIREDLDFIKGHMVDVDSIMTEDDYLSLNEFKEWLVFNNDIDTGKKVLSKFFQIDIKKEEGQNNKLKQRFSFKNKISDFELQFLKFLIQVSKNTQNKLKL